MPLFRGTSPKTISKNVSKLMTEKPSKRRKKGIKTIAKRRGVSEKEAERIQANAIAYNMARRSNNKDFKSGYDGRGGGTPTGPTDVSPYTEAKRRTTTLDGNKRPSRMLEQEFFGTGYMPVTDLASSSKAMSKSRVKEMEEAKGPAGMKAMEELKKQMNRPRKNRGGGRVTKY